MTGEIEQLEHDAVADESRSLTFRSRGTVYVVAGILILISIVLAALRVGEQAGRLSDWQALALGATQGFSELLPISSSGHLILVPWLADWKYLEAHPDFNKTFDVALHLGTLVAVVAYFWARRDHLSRAPSSRRSARVRSGPTTSGSPSASRSQPCLPRSPAHSGRAQSRTTSASPGRSASRSRSSRSCSTSPTAGRRRRR